LPQPRRSPNTQRRITPTTTIAIAIRLSGISLIELLKAKKEWLKNRYPDEFGSEGSTFDADAFFSAPYYNRREKENDNESE
jgi:hypothetical protein